MCGIVGVYGDKQASRMVYDGIYAIHHRGQEGVGIGSFDGRKFYKRRGIGWISDVFPNRESLEKLPGYTAIGHNRYSTTGRSEEVNLHPIYVDTRFGPLAIVHNGNLVNAKKLRRGLEEEGAIFQGTTDTEVLLHLVAKSREKNVVDKTKDALTQVRGAYSLLLLSKEGLIAARDPNGFRPLVLGKLNRAWVLASETCAFDLIGAEYLRDVEPGELIFINEKGLSSFQFEKEINYTYCIFELIYFSRPDSKVFGGDYVDKFRRKFGKNLAIKKPADADIVIAVPDSSNTAALGFSHQSGTIFEIGLIRSHFIGRTFIEPDPQMRDHNVRIKFNPVGGVLEGRRVVVVEDSIVRGTTLKQLTGMIRKSGAKEVHVRVSSPPIRYPCFYGMDFPSPGELAINIFGGIEGIREHLEVDSLGYLSLEGLLSSVPHENCGYCTACFSGKYPVLIPKEKFTKEILEE